MRTTVWWICLIVGWFVSLSETDFDIRNTRFSRPPDAILTSIEICNGSFNSSMHFQHSFNPKCASFIIVYLKNLVWTPLTESVQSRIRSEGTDSFVVRQQNTDRTADTTVRCCQPMVKFKSIQRWQERWIWTSSWLSMNFPCFAISYHLLRGERRGTWWCPTSSNPAGRECHPLTAINHFSLSWDSSCRISIKGFTSEYSY